MSYFLLFTILFLPGLGVIDWVHSQYQMDIIARPAEVHLPALLISESLIVCYGHAQASVVGSASRAYMRG